MHRTTFQLRIDLSAEGTPFATVFSHDPRTLMHGDWDEMIAIPLAELTIDQLGAFARIVARATDDTEILAFWRADVASRELIARKETGVHRAEN